ncbi:MAG: hypothetical protein K2R98_11050 [Gemmataceae bacterium]|nr:hypothetical protein [Gemmataceae bacterium]
MAQWNRDWSDDPVLPAPTRARPGSHEKIAVLRARLERGEALHHPKDERQAIHHIPHTPMPALSA